MKMPFSRYTIIALTVWGRTGISATIDMSATNNNILDLALSDRLTSLSPCTNSLASIATRNTTTTATQPNGAFEEDISREIRALQSARPSLNPACLLNVLAFPDDIFVDPAIDWKKKTMVFAVDNHHVLCVETNIDGTWLAPEVVALDPAALGYVRMDWSEVRLDSARVVQLIRQAGIPNVIDDMIVAKLPMTMPSEFAGHVIWQFGQQRRSPYKEVLVRDSDASVWTFRGSHTGGCFEKVV